MNWFGLSKFGMRRWLLDKSTDGGQGSGASPAEETDDVTGDENVEKDGKKEKAPAEITFSDEQQKLVDRLVGDARTKEREKAKTEAQAEAARAKKKADEEALTQKEEWKTLADQRATDLAAVTKERDDLLAQKELADKYRTALEGMVKETLKALPKHVAPLVEKMDPVEALEYFTQHGKELNLQVHTKYPNTPRDKEKRDKPTGDEEEAARRTVGRIHTSSF